MASPGDTDGCIFLGGQANIHFSILADQATPNVVFVGGDRQIGPLPNTTGARNWTGRLFRGDSSLAAANQWTSITDNGASGTGPHADSRIMVFGFGNNDILEGDD